MGPGAGGLSGAAWRDLILCAGVGLCVSVLSQRGDGRVVHAAGDHGVVGRAAARAAHDDRAGGQQPDLEGDPAVNRSRDKSGGQSPGVEALEEISTGSTSIIDAQFYWSVGGGLLLLAIAAAATSTDGRWKSAPTRRLSSGCGGRAGNAHGAGSRSPGRTTGNSWGAPKGQSSGCSCIQHFHSGCSWRSDGTPNRT